MNEPTLQELGARLRQAWQGWIDPADDDYDAAWERLDAVVNALLSRLDAQPANNERALAAALAMCGDKDRKLYLYGEHQGWCKAKEIATIISRHYVVDAQPEDGRLAEATAHLKELVEALNATIRDWDEFYKNMPRSEEGRVGREGR